MHADLRSSWRRHLSHHRPPLGLDFARGRGVLQPSRLERYTGHRTNPRTTLQLDMVGFDVFDDRVEAWRCDGVDIITVVAVAGLQG